MALFSAMGLKPRYCAVVDGIAVRDIAHGLTLIAPFQRFVHLTRGQFALATKLYTARDGAGAAFASPGADQFALELGKATRTVSLGGRTKQRAPGRDGV